jgi:hypothetical protein
MIKETVSTHWPGINFLENVLLVLPVPVEYSERAKSIMRQCIYEANLIEHINSKNLRFITERKYL